MGYLTSGVVVAGGIVLAVPAMGSNLPRPGPDAALHAFGVLVCLLGRVIGLWVRERSRE